MSSYRYCVLWIPTRLHKKIQPVLPSRIDENTEKFTREYQEDNEGNILIEEQISLKDILSSDEAEKKVYLDLTLLKNNSCLLYKKGDEAGDTISSCYIPKRDIEIKAKDATGKVFDTLLLHCLDARRNGLFMYEYEVHEKYLNQTISKNRYLLNSNSNIINVLYHSIKSFYHVHEFHSPNNDSLLHPYSSGVRIDLNSPNNPALLHYLNEFEKKFLDEDDFTKSLMLFADKTYNNLLSQKKNIDAYIAPEAYYDIIQRIINCMETGYIECQNQCNSVLNIYLYYQSLFYSKHNKIFNLKYDGTHKYELCEESMDTRQMRKSILTLSPLPYQLLMPNGVKQNNTFLGANECYKKAINIYNAIESIRLRQKEVSTFINKEFLTVIYSYSNLISIQTNNIQTQAAEIKEQATKVDNQTIEIQNLTKKTSDLSSKLTIKTTRIGILTGIISSVVFFHLSMIFTYSPEDDLQTLNDSLNATKRLQQEQIDIRNQQLEEIKTLIINLNNEIRVEQEEKQIPQKSI